MEPDQKRAADVLVQWREVERAMEDPAIGQAGMEALQVQADRVRHEYEQLVGPRTATSDVPD